MPLKIKDRVTENYQLKYDYISSSKEKPMGKLLFSVRIHLLINSVNEYLVNIFHVPNTVVFYKSKVVKKDCIK